MGGAHVPPYSLCQGPQADRQPPGQAHTGCRGLQILKATTLAPGKEWWRSPWRSVQPRARVVASHESYSWKIFIISLLILFTNLRHKLETTQSFQARYWTGAARLNTFVAVTAMLHYLLQHTLHTPHMGLELDHAAKIAASAESSLAWERSRVCMICNGLPKLPYVRHFWHGERLRDL